ncbi:MAG: sialidase family protein [Spirochaetales bacterium]|nr:sialidase family protein [Spirochaetales bacterium]
MKRIFLPISLMFGLIFACSHGSSETGSDGDSGDSSWDSVKSSVSPSVALSDEFSNPQMLPIATMGWEDGLNVSRDGLHLYATYIPADFLSFTLNETENQANIQYYDRGPHYDMDFDGSSIGVDYPWYHSDIIYASRSSVEEDFSDWNTSDMKRSVQSEGAITTVQSDTGIDMCVFTSNEKYLELNNFKYIKDSANNPSGLGTFLSDTANDGETDQVNTYFVEDNPHLERISDDILVLFFDSEDRPGGLGLHDIWYSSSSDNGGTWATPINVSTVNTADKEHQPHLYYDDTLDLWWLYYSAYHTDGKLAIYRVYQEADTWDNWSTPELVLSAGTSAGIGEPTLTDEGDLYFVLIYDNPDGTDYDRYDADPWFVEALVE